MIPSLPSELISLILRFFTESPLDDPYSEPPYSDLLALSLLSKKYGQKAREELSRRIYRRRGVSIARELHHEFPAGGGEVVEG